MNGMKKILIVDDSESIRTIIVTVLESDYNVVTAVDGLDALEKLTEIDDIDLVITDLHMPNLDGIGLIAEIRNKDFKYKRVPCLLLTTETQVSEKMKAKEAGATGWIIKPFVNSKLLLSIKKVIH